jgi:DNA-binding beta-propeller fold protein YncE
MKQKIRWTAMGIAALAVFPSWAATSPGYKVEDKIRIEGDQGWDLLAVDDSSGAVFLTHGDRVQAVDPGTGKLLGTVTGIDGAHGVALVPDIGKGYATSGKDSAVVVFDLKTFTTLARLHTPGAKPDAIQFDPASRRVFAGLAGSDELAAFDVATSKLAGTVSLPGNPELMAVDGKGMLFVNIENKSEVAAIDAKTLKVVSIWPLAPGEEPTGLAVDPDSKRLFAGCHNHLMVALDATTGKVVASLPVGDHIDGAAFDPVLKRAYAPGGDGTLTVIQEQGPDKFTVLETVDTKKGARTIAIDAKTHHLYLPTADYGPMPAASAAQPHQRPPLLPGTFTLLDVFPVD